MNLHHGDPKFYIHYNGLAIYLDNTDNPKFLSILYIIPTYLIVRNIIWIWIDMFVFGRY